MKGERGKEKGEGSETSRKSWSGWHGNYSAWIPSAGEEDTRLLLRLGWEEGSWITLKSTSFKAAASRVQRSKGGLCRGYSIDVRAHLTELVAAPESLAGLLLPVFSSFFQTLAERPKHFAFFQLRPRRNVRLHRGFSSGV